MAGGRACATAAAEMDGGGLTDQQRAPAAADRTWLSSVWRSETIADKATGAVGALATAIFIGLVVCVSHPPGY